MSAEALRGVVDVCAFARSRRAHRTTHDGTFKLYTVKPLYKSVAKNLTQCCVNNIDHLVSRFRLACLLLYYTPFRTYVPDVRVPHIQSTVVVAMFRKGSRN